MEPNPLDIGGFAVRILSSGKRTGPLIQWENVRQTVPAGKTFTMDLGKENVDRRASAVATMGKRLGFQGFQRLSKRSDVAPQIEFRLSSTLNLGPAY